MYYLVIEKIVRYEAETKKEVEDWIETIKNNLNKELEKLNLTEEEVLGDVFEYRFKENGDYYVTSDGKNIWEAIFPYSEEYEILEDRIVEINSETYLFPPYSFWNIQNTIFNKLRNREIIHSLKIDGVVPTFDITYGNSYSFNREDVYAYLFDPESEGAIFVNNQVDIIKKLCIDRTIDGWLGLIKEVKDRLKNEKYNKSLIQIILKLNKILTPEEKIRKTTEININGEIIEIDIHQPYSTIENTIIEKLKEGVIIKSMNIDEIEINREMLKNMNIYNIDYPLTDMEAYMAVYEPASEIAIFLDSQIDVIKELIYISIDNILTNLIQDTANKLISWEESEYSKEYIRLIFELSDVLKI